MKATYRFRNRVEAGRQLARALRKFAHQPGVIVLALPRGGVPVGHEIAKALGCPLDVLIVRKLGVPGQEELAMGAIASGGIRVLNREVVNLLKMTPEEIEQATRREQRELERRERAYRGGQPPLDVRDRVVLLVDDGLATGTTMRAAVSALRKLGARQIVAAIPVGAAQSCEALRGDVDELVCLLQPDDLIAISMWYDEFPQTTDQEVQDLLKQTEPSLPQKLAGGRYIF
jgi:putative phosphoribosyl transferase